jgi:hypothetical protein
MKIQRGICKRVFFHNGCSCCKDGYYAYGLALDKTGVWPLEEVMQGKDSISIQKVLDGLSTFNSEPPNGTCKLCSQDFGETVVSKVIESVQENFEGLCLDCIDEPRRKDWDWEYVKHSSKFSSGRRPGRASGEFIPAHDWDEGCRITHDQPTWWFSWQVRKQFQDSFDKEREGRVELGKRKRTV